MTGKYSIIFMFDGGKTIRWRVGPVLLRALLILLVLVPLVAAGSLWLNWKLWQGHQTLQAENAALQRTVESNAQTTARLANLEQFLSKTDPEGLGSLVAANPAAPRSALPKTSPAPVVSAVAPDNTEATATPSGTEQPTEQPVDATAPSAPLSAAGSTTADSRTEPATPQPPTWETPAASLPVPEGAETPSSISEADAGDGVVDKGLARVENLVARRVGTRSLRISFDLYNTEQVPQLSGKASFELILADGTTYPLAAHGDTTYRINRLKKIVGNPTLPPDVTETQNAAVRVSIYADDDLIYQIVTPLRQ